MILYHGSNVEFDSIDLLKSKPNKDFGKGFYLSDNYDQAFEMAKRTRQSFHRCASSVLTIIPRNGPNSSF